MKVIDEFRVYAYTNVMSSLSSLDLIHAFRGVMEHGSLSAAARALGLAQPTVRRHVEQLEAELGARLFTRASNGLTPTPMAHSLLPIARAVASEADAFVRAATADATALRGTVRLTCSRVFGAHVIPQVLAPLRATAPEILIELTVTDQSENMLRRAADIAIRFAQPTQGAIVTRKLPPVPLGLFATPGLVAAGMTDDLQDCPFISDDRDRVIEPALALRDIALSRRVVLRSDDALAQLAAMTAGMGVGVCQCAIADRLGLVRVRPDLGFEMPLFLAMHEDQAQIARIRAVFDHLAATLPQWI